MDIPGCIPVKHDEDCSGILNKAYGRYYVVEDLELLVDRWLDALMVVWRTYGDTNPSGSEAHDILDSWGLINKKP